MMKTACFLVAIALCAATAPPRISLELANQEMPSSFHAAAVTLTQTLHTHQVDVKGHNGADYAEACGAMSTEADCVFPKAKGWDANDGEVVVTTAIYTVTDSAVTEAGYDRKTDETYATAADTPGILNAVGSYLFQYTATDSKDQAATVVDFFLLVNDVTPPTCDTTCMESIVLTEDGCDTAVTDNVGGLDACTASITCTDNVDDITKANGRLVISATTYTGSLDTKNLKAHVTVSASDAAGLYGRNGASNTFTEQFEFHVSDTSKPTFLNVVSEIALECNRDDSASDTIVADGEITCTDTCTTVAPTRTTTPAYSTVNAQVVGDITVDLTCADHYGNFDNMAQKFVVTDNTAPVLEFDHETSVVKFPIIPVSQVNDEQNRDTFHEQAKYTCDHSGAGIHNLDTSGQSTDARTNTECKIDYEETLNLGALRTLITVTDTCCLNENNTLSAAWDTNDDPAFNPSVKGTYHRIFTATDCNGNTATHTVTIELEDTNAPVVTPVNCDVMNPNGSDCITTTEASATGTFVDQGAKCLDYVDGDLSSRVEVSGDVVNLAVPNTYVISYSCTDYGSQIGTSVRTVIVQDTSPPVLSFSSTQGDSFLVHEAGETYTDLGCTMTDTVDGTCVSGDVATCNIVTHGNTVNQNGMYFMKTSCASIRDVCPLCSDGMYVISPTHGANLKRQTVACAFDDTVAITAQAQTVTAAKTQAEATAHCVDNFATDSAALSTTTLSATESTALGLVLAENAFASTETRTNFVCVFNTKTATDDAVDGKLTAAVDRVQHAFAHVGVWVIKYVGTDNAGLTATDLLRTVMVKDTLPPIISLVHPDDSTDTLYEGVGTVNGVVIDSVSPPVPVSLMAQASVNGYFVCAIASAVAGVALLGFSAKKTQTMVPV
jgi:hypothetical protein